MSLTFRPARRANVPLLLSVTGGTGSGKTFSSLRLATGIAGGHRFAVIDTENGRACHYADRFQFDVADLEAPFTPEKYQDAILAAAAAGYPVIVVDSMSHEHAGDGGLLDMHEAEVNRMAGQNLSKREAVKMAAWIKPKMQHKALVTKLLQLNAHVILCFRAEQKIDIGKDERGRTVIRPKMSLVGLDGWVPVSEKSLPYEMTMSVLLTADAPGVPKPIKLPEQFREFVPLNQPLGEDVGKRLAEWAAGDSQPMPAPRQVVTNDTDQAPAYGEETAPTDDAPKDRVELLRKMGREVGGKAATGVEEMLQKPCSSDLVERAIARLNEIIDERAARAEQDAGEPAQTT